MDTTSAKRRREKCTDNESHKENAEHDAPCRKIIMHEDYRRGKTDTDHHDHRIRRWNGKVNPAFLTFKNMFFLE